MKLHVESAKFIMGKINKEKRLTKQLRSDFIIYFCEKAAAEQTDHQKQEKHWSLSNCAGPQ